MVKLYLGNGRPHCYGTKGMGVNRMPWCKRQPVCDLEAEKSVRDWGNLKPRSHIACNLEAEKTVRDSGNLNPPVTHSLQPVGDLLATKILDGPREVAGWLQGGRWLVGDRLQKVAGTIWSQGGFGCCKWNLSATKSIVERFLVVADRLPTGRRLVGDWSPTSCNGCRQSRHSF